MLINSLRTRGTRFAFLLAPPRYLRREDAVRVYTAVCDQLRTDDFSFKYNPSASQTNPESQAFSLTVHRPEGNGGFTLELAGAGVDDPNILRLAFDWPQSFEHVRETFDLACGAVEETLASHGDAPDRVLAECRLRAQCDVRTESSLEFLRETLLRPQRSWIEGLGRPLHFGSIRFEVGASHPQEGDSLGGAARHLSIEVLRDDPRCLFIELMSQWPQIPPPIAGSGIDLTKIRPIDRKPSEYLADAQDYLKARLESLEAPRGGTES